MSQNNPLLISRAQVFHNNILPTLTVNPGTLGTTPRVEGINKDKLYNINHYGWNQETLSKIEWETIRLLNVDIPGYGFIYSLAYPNSDKLPPPMRNKIFWIGKTELLKNRIVDHLSLTHKVSVGNGNDYTVDGNHDKVKCIKLLAKMNLIPKVSVLEAPIPLDLLGEREADLTQKHLLKDPTNGEWLAVREGKQSMGNFKVKPNTEGIGSLLSNLLPTYFDDDGTKKINRLLIEWSVARLIASMVKDYLTIPEIKEKLKSELNELLE